MIASAIVAALLLLAVESRAMGQHSDLPPFWKSRLSDVEEAVRQVHKGQAQVLTQSAEDGISIW